MIIYKVTNLITGEIYVGQTRRTLNDRYNDHIKRVRKGSKLPLHTAIRQYGVDSFKFEEICKASNLNELNTLERYYIEKYDCINNGYNLNRGGSSTITYSLSNDVRAKISQGMKEYRSKHPFTEEHRKKLSLSAMGNHNFGSSDTRSIGCYCVLENGEKYYFHSYRDAYKWWSTIDNPFDSNAECVYQRKIKQSIQTGYYKYKRKTYHYPVWYKKDGDV